MWGKDSQTELIDLEIFPPGNSLHEPDAEAMVQD
jgi:hypothetical protein